jgi:predicted permease
VKGGVSIKGKMLGQTSTTSIPKYLLFLTFTPTLIIRLIQKIKVMKKSNINCIYLIFFITLIFLIRQMVKVGIKVKCDKYLGMVLNNDNMDGS